MAHIFHYFQFIIFYPKSAAPGPPPCYLIKTSSANFQQTHSRLEWNSFNRKRAKYNFQPAEKPKHSLIK